MKPVSRPISLLPLYTAVILCFLFIIHFTSQSVTVMVEHGPVSDRTCIIVDAGHGGIDGGATSCSGILESELNLQIALRLNDLLHFIGYDTKMIRTTDTSIHTEGNTIAAQKVSDLKQRVKLVNETDNALLLSIHQNTYPDSRYSGAQVFYAKDKISMELAQKMQGSLISALNPGSKRRCKSSDSIYLMQNINTPGLLIECGFLSNPAEESKLRDPEYQQHLCCVIAACCSEFLQQTPLICQ